MLADIITIPHCLMWHNWYNVSGIFLFYVDKTATVSNSNDTDRDNSLSTDNNFMADILQIQNF